MNRKKDVRSIKVPSISANFVKVERPVWLLWRLGGGLGDDDLKNPYILTRQGEELESTWQDDKNTLRREEILNYELLESSKMAELVCKENNWFYFPPARERDSQFFRVISFNSFIGGLDAIIPNFKNIPGVSEEKREEDRELKDAIRTIESFKADNAYIQDETVLRYDSFRNRLTIVGSLKSEDNTRENDQLFYTFKRSFAGSTNFEIENKYLYQEIPAYRTSPDSVDRVKTATYSLLEKKYNKRHGVDLKVEKDRIKIDVGAINYGEPIRSLYDAIEVMNFTTKCLNSGLEDEMKQSKDRADRQLETLTNSIAGKVSLT